MRKSDSALFITVAIMVLLFYGLYSSFEYGYEAVRESYPGLTRWEYFMYSKHLIITPKDKVESVKK